MVASPENESPAARKAATGRRRRPRRESALLWWAGFAAIAVAAAWLRSWRLALAGLLLWCLYQFVLVPTICRIMTRQGYSCREPARGRLFACRPEHQRVKNDALWRLAGRRNPRGRRPAPPPDPNRDTGVVVYTPSVRGRLAQTDRLMILTAAVGTLTAVTCAFYGF
ncbi:hypothetical protein [Actinomadura macrotermitis]|uniref:Uncharacterized protein n=1 Tax=Actinomadura macrotermitis TaxID=2585200 RepID=A0A7K0BTQ3_9ACTN|nr:hypothetical protein [Actinomadura macrotermitis]MQY04416.1 hypothetical protein [Actinomadura macrotermitis]